MYLRTCTILFLVALLCQHGYAEDGLPAFPGAEGYGANAVGGRSGEVLFVTNLLDYDPAAEKPVTGSLRAACLAEGPRTVVFDVSGTIPLKAPLIVTEPYLTMAGQTAPGDGICVTRHGLNVSGTHDVIVRHMRFRLGDAVAREREAAKNDSSFTSDSISVSRSQNVIIDHCSASWSTDEVLSVGHTPLDNVTVQWCFITEALNDSAHPKGAHGYGGIDSRAANAHISRHHNLYAHNGTRSPKVGSVHDENLDQIEKEFGIKDNGLDYDFRNNVIYNWITKAGYTSESHDRIRMNYVANYLKTGPDTKEHVAFHAYKRARIHIADNMMNGKRKAWQIVPGEHQKCVEPFPAPKVTTTSATTAFYQVLQQGGATLPRRDAVDIRIAKELTSGSGKIIDSQNEVGGYPVFKTESRPAGYDTDRDGMPNTWETKHGLDPATPDNNIDLDQDGYTNLEEFINATNPTRTNRGMGKR